MTAAVLLRSKRFLTAGANSTAVNNILILVEGRAFAPFEISASLFLSCLKVDEVVDVARGHKLLVPRIVELDHVLHRRTQIKMG